MISRRNFILNVSAFSLAGISAFGQDKRPAPLDAEKVKEFVRLGHFDLPGATQMLTEMPSILHSTYDWGGGDFETALGGASHMGRKDIAEFLISKGARMDIFTAAMLNKIEIVKPIIETFPDALNCKGPHTITLLMHAQKGEAKEVIEYLKGKGLTK